MKQGWERKKFEDCIGKIPKPQQLKTSDYKLEGRFPIVSQESSIISGYTDFENYVYRVPKPVVVFGDHTRVLKYVDFDFVVGADGVKILVPTNDIISKYFYYFLIWYNVPSLGYSRHYKLLKEIDIPVPPLPIQERIVEELDCISGIIEKKKEQLKELDALAQSIFYTMFGDPVENDKGWEVKKLGEVGEIIAGSTPSTTDPTNWDGEINWITPAEMGNQLYYGETVRKITEKAAKGLTLMPIGTVLLSTRAPIGKLAISTIPMCCNQGFKNIICKYCLNNLFLYYYLLLTMENIKALGRGATFKEVSKKSISDYNVILPPLPLQQEFAKKIEAIEKQKELIKASIGEVETLLASRMQEYFE